MIPQPAWHPSVQLKAVFQVCHFIGVKGLPSSITEIKPDNFYSTKMKPKIISSPDLKFHITETFLLLKHPIYHSDNQLDFGAIYLPQILWKLQNYPVPHPKLAVTKDRPAHQLL